MNRTLYKFEGELLAVSPLAVSRPGDNFASARHSEQLRRLPRIGVKQESAAVYFPATTLRRLFRESARNAVFNAMQKIRSGPPFSLSTHMMLSSGIDISNRILHEKTGGRIDGETALREKNPLLSLFGRWKLAGHLHVGNALPPDNSCVYIEGAGARQIDFERTPELIENFSADDVDVLKKFIARDSATLRHETEGGKSEAVRRPLEGFEAIRAGTAMNHAMRLDCASTIELGLLLASLREAARHPLVGAHRNLGCGEIRGEYAVITWPLSEASPKNIGTVKFGFDGFSIAGEPLENALEQWDECAKNIFEHFDFDRYLIEDDSD